MRGVAAIGAELGIGIDLFYRAGFNLRAGVGVPVTGPGSARAYVRLGPAF